MGILIAGLLVPTNERQMLSMQLTSNCKCMQMHAEHRRMTFLGTSVMLGMLLLHVVHQATGCKVGLSEQINELAGI